MSKLDIFVKRLRKIGIEIDFWNNYPWVYIRKINGKYVNDKFQSDYAFVIGYLPIRKDKDFQFTDLSEIFKIIKKYK